jgi:hypothetical protein
MRRAVLVLAASVLAGAACRPSPGQFYDRAFACTGATPGECGTAEDGAPMTCFAATALGAASGFCAPACDGTTAPGPDRPPSPASAADDSTTMCLTTGASLRRCHPSDDDAQRGTRACPAGLECMRTDLIADDGLCTTAPLCYGSKTCQTADRPFCGGDLVGMYFKPDPRLHTDHLPCMKALCHTTGSACPASEMCLPDVVRVASAPPDLCMPGCVNLRCPPNYECWQRLSAAGPPVCVPALAGVRCADSQDCLVGDCLPIGEPGFDACTVTCASDDDCKLFDGPRGAFVCAPALDSGLRYCVTPEIFTGTLCNDDTQCRPSEKCVFSSVNQGPTDIGYCLVPCAPDGTCQPRAGIPHACRRDGPIPVCYPGKLATPCQAEDECVGDLSCRFIPGELDLTDQPITTPLCTHACASDADCAADRFTPLSWCENGFCALKRPADRVCPQASACQSGMCAASPRPDDEAAGLSRCTTPVITL